MAKRMSRQVRRRLAREEQKGKRKQPFLAWPLRILLVVIVGLAVIVVLVRQPNQQVVESKPCPDFVYAEGSGVMATVYPPTAVERSHDEAEAQALHWQEDYIGPDDVNSYIDLVVHQMETSDSPIGKAVASFMQDNSPQFRIISVDYSGQEGLAMGSEIDPVEDVINVYVDRTKFTGHNRWPVMAVAFVISHEFGVHVSDWLAMIQAQVDKGATLSEAWAIVRQKLAKTNPEFDARKACSEMRGVAMNTAMYYQMQGVYRHEYNEADLAVLQSVSWNWQAKKWFEEVVSPKNLFR